MGSVGFNGPALVKPVRSWNTGAVVAGSMNGAWEIVGRSTIKSRRKPPENLMPKSDQPVPERRSARIGRGKIGYRADNKPTRSIQRDRSPDPCKHDRHVVGR